MAKLIRWRHYMETFYALLAFVRGIGGFLLQRPVTRSFHVFFDLRLNNGLMFGAGVIVRLVWYIMGKKNVKSIAIKNSAINAFEHLSSPQQASKIRILLCRLYTLPVTECDMRI